MIPGIRKETDMTANTETIKAYWMATMNLGETREEMEQFWSTEEGMEDLMDWFEGEIEAGLTEEEMNEVVGKTTKEDKKMTSINKMFTLDGVHYTENKSGYCYKTTGKKDKKGNDITMRISRKVFEDRYDEYLNMEAELDKWEDRKPDWNEADDEEWQNMSDKELKDRMTMREKSDKAAEDAVNGKKKAKKARRSKDVAFELKENGETVMTLTAKQVDFMKHLPDTCFWENGLDSAVWCDVLADEIGGQFAGKPMTVGAMISTLREKGIVEVGRDLDRKGKPKFMALTDLGKQIATGMGLN